MASLYEAKPLNDVTVDDWDLQLQVDLRAGFLCSMAAVPHMRARGGGRIINFSDWVAASGRPRYPGYLPYFVAKRGVIALTEALAFELAADQILVNAIAPGPILPAAGSTPEEHAAVEKVTPLGRWGGEDEIAKAAMFLVDQRLRDRRDDPRGRRPSPQVGRAWRGEEHGRPPAAAFRAGISARCGRSGSIRR